MSAAPKHDAPPRMTADEFLVWAEGRPGRYELDAGAVVAMSRQRARHARAKSRVQRALEAPWSGAIPPARRSRTA